MLARTPMNLYVSLLNLKSTGFGNSIERTSSPFAVENPKCKRKYLTVLSKLLSVFTYAIDFLNLSIRIKSRIRGLSHVHFKQIRKFLFLKRQRLIYSAGYRTKSCFWWCIYVLYLKSLSTTFQTLTLSNQTITLMLVYLCCFTVITWSRHNETNILEVAITIYWKEADQLLAHLSYTELPGKMIRSEGAVDFHCLLLECLFSRSLPVQT